MATNLPIEVIRKQEWLEPIAERLQPTIAAALGADGPVGPKIADILHGTWLGHPLHVVLTDVPIGSWTAAAVLDALEEKTGSRALGRGVHASGMPSWKPLLRQERADLVAYIKTFSSAFQEEKPGEPVVIPAEPAATAESIKRGSELFQSMNCWSCHGKDGRGHGPSAAALTDNKGNAITPFDFTSGTQFKCGETDRDMFRDLVTGLDGTPMPSFVGAMTADQRWDVVHYIRTFATSKAHPEAKDNSAGQ